MVRGSLTRSSTSSAPPQTSSSFATFDDEENFIMGVLISMHEEILGSTASSGPAVDAKNKVWNLISDRLCNKIGGIYRSDEQVKARWRSMRSAYSFKIEKPRHIAELFYKKFQSTSHRVRASDVTVVGIKFPQWLNNLTKNDSIFKSKPQNSSQQQQLQVVAVPTTTSSKRVSMKRASPTVDNEEEEEDEVPERKRTRPIRTCSTVPKLVSQYPPSELSTVRGNRSYKQERRKSPSPDSVSPTSAVAQEELNSVTESGTNSPLQPSVFWEETEYETRRRREEELHQAKLSLLRSQTHEADAKTQLTKLQIKALINCGTTAASTLPPPPASSSCNIVDDEVETPLEITSLQTLLDLEISNQTAKI
uniref:Regulatory protein zeste n=1 Tax=Panagrolaimus sp. ES5 TaxID=591445 RepID=A0AC34GSH2_9BILA